MAKRFFPDIRVEANSFRPISDRSGESASDHHESPRTPTVRHLSTLETVRALHPSPSMIRM